MRKKRNGSSRYFFYFLFSVLILFAIYSGIKEIVTRWNFFTISQIVIEGNNNLESEFLKNLSSDFIKQNLYAVSKKDIHHKYENIPRIKKIEISRVFPDKLKIEIVEKLGKFYIRSKQGELFPISAGKEILDNNFSYSENMPVISTDINSDDIKIGDIIEDPLVDRVFDLEKQLALHASEITNKISEYIMEDDVLYLIEMNSGHRIIFGEHEDLEYQIAKYRNIENNRPYKHGQIVDLRFEDKLVIKMEEK